MKSPSTRIKSSKLRTQAEEALRNGDPARAELHLLQLLAQDEGDAAAIGLLGDVARARGDARLAMGYYALAIRAEPAELEHKRKFMALAWNVPFSTYNVDVENGLLECLKTPDLDGGDMRAPWFTILTLYPAFRALYLAVLEGEGPSNLPADTGPLLRPFFLLGLGKIVINDPGFETFLTRLRRFLLDGADAPEPLAAALAHYCFNTDYIFDVTPDEQEKVDGLRKKIEGGDTRGALVYACYAPLWTLRNAGNAAHALRGGAAGAEVARAQVDDWLALQKTAAKIEAVTAIDNGTSVKVREQYESFPYPRWQGLPRVLLEGLKENADILGRPGATALVAGCGTGQQPLQYAAAWPSAQFLAVDLSRASLAYAVNKAREYGVRNIDFRQGDILKLGALPQKFDYVICSGVLHHMQDPVAGWKVLNGLLKPGGTMFISLYSKVARKAIARVRDIIARNDIPATTAGIRAFRRDAGKLLDAETLLELWRSPDYFNTSTCCDLLFHAREYQFDLPEIAGVLEELGLDFLGFRLPATVSRDHVADLPRGADAKNLESWHAFELENPTTFLGMYHFWCRKRR